MNDDIFTTAIRMARMWGIRECLEENFTPLENPHDLALQGRNRALLMDWAAEFCSLKGKDLDDFFLEKSKVLENYEGQDYRKEKRNTLLLRQLKTRLSNEFNAFKKHLALAPLTAEELLNRAYEVAWKEEIVYLFERMTNADNRYTDELLLWILKKPDALDFLYDVWQHVDYLLAGEFHDLLYDGLAARKDGGADE